jgi:hypothetical protein
MTRDELIIHWREVLAVPDDVGDARTRQLCRQVAALLLEMLAGVAHKWATPRPTAAEQQEREHVERQLAEASLAAARAEALADTTARAFTPAEQAATNRLLAAEAKLAELDAGVRRGELVQKADVVKAIDRGLQAALATVRNQVIAGGDIDALSEDERLAWWTGVVDAALAAAIAPVKALQPH